MQIKIELNINLNEKNFKHLSKDEIEKIVNEFQEKVLINKIRYDLDYELSKKSHEKCLNLSK